MVNIETVKLDIENVGAELKRDIEALRAELKHDMKESGIAPDDQTWCDAGSCGWHRGHLGEAALKPMAYRMAIIQAKSLIRRCFHSAQYSLANYDPYIIETNFIFIN